MASPRRQVWGILLNMSQRGMLRFAVLRITREVAVGLAAQASRASVPPKVAHPEST
jgi:hypothetical protein